MPDTRKIIPASEMRHQLGGISVATEHRWRSEGILPKPIKINRQNYYLASVADELIHRIEDARHA